MFQLFLISVSEVTLFAVLELWSLAVSSVNCPNLLEIEVTPRFRGYRMIWAVVKRRVSPFSSDIRAAVIFSDK